MNTNHTLVVFQGKNIRRIGHNNEDSTDPKRYIKKMRQRDPILDANRGTLCTLLEILALDGKKINHKHLSDDQNN